MVCWQDRHRPVCCMKIDSLFDLVGKREIMCNFAGDYKPDKQQSYEYGCEPLRRA